MIKCEFCFWYYSLKQRQYYRNTPYVGECRVNPPTMHVDIPKEIKRVAARLSYTPSSEDVKQRKDLVRYRDQDVMGYYPIVEKSMYCSHYLPKDSEIAEKLYRYKYDSPLKYDFASPELNGDKHDEDKSDAKKSEE